MQFDLGTLKRHFLSREFLLFLVVGCINTFLCSFLAELLTPLLGNANVAFNAGYLLSNINAYILNGWLVFPTRLTLARYVKFFLSYVPNYIIQNIIVLVFYNWLGLPSLVSFLIAAVLGVPITFLFVKIFAFGRR
ncbi:GtrA family protein [Mitsuokella sp. AF21-1AC]|uniref:GtrA family protein n=1 Tax=Mitsuokella sp. AF21-1AC TaxID=2292235 RepID=UPI000E487EA9|nr:GtrA family protein [Mitsuokella sp. AF21-1AC]RGS70543.1 GtrA family protein [Mitsuokella sp. AF21-1AC]